MAPTMLRRAPPASVLRAKASAGIEPELSNSRQKPAEAHGSPQCGLPDASRLLGVARPAPARTGTSQEGEITSRPDAEVLLRTLRTSPVFKGGKPASLASLVRQATPLEYRAGAFLVRQGEPAAHVFVLTKGEVAIVSPARGGAEQVLGIVGKGDLLGELALLTNGRRTAGARATSDTVAWAIGRDAFWAFLEETPSGSSALLRQVAER